MKRIEDLPDSALDVMLMATTLGHHLAQSYGNSEASMIRAVDDIALFTSLITQHERERLALMVEGMADLGMVKGIDNIRHTIATEIREATDTLELGDPALLAPGAQKALRDRVIQRFEAVIQAAKKQRA